MDFVRISRHPAGTIDHGRVKNEETGPHTTVPVHIGMVSRLIDGPHRWGAYTVTVGRYGIVNYRLVLYPPGTTVQERRRIRLCRSWIAAGIASGLVLFIALRQAEVPVIAAVLAALALYVVGAVVTARRAGAIRHRVLALAAARSTLAPDPRQTEVCGYLAQQAAAMRDADESLDAGSCTVVEHELVWSAVYEEAREHLEERRMFARHQI
jgi:hypothetical protein